MALAKLFLLIRFWEKYADDHSIMAPVPVFIPLNEYNGWRVKFDPRDESDNFIISFIARFYLTGNETFSLDEKNALLENLRQPLSQSDQSYLPSIIFLLDGFNEISVSQNDLIIALNWLHQDFPGLQIGLTSRHEMSSFSFAKKSTVAHLQPLDLSKVNQYLFEQNVEPVNLPQKDQEDLLRNPMLLTLYAASSDLFVKYKDDRRRFDFKPTMTSKGEILWNFLEAQRARFYRDDEDQSEAADMVVYKLILQYFLPLLGHRMVKEGQLFFHWENLQSILDEAINHIKTPIFGTHYQVKHKVFRMLQNRLQLNESSDNRISIDIIMAFLIKQLKLVVVESEGQEDLEAHEESQSQYVFLHQNFRDFFAAKHIQKQIEISLKDSKDEFQFPIEFSEMALNFYVRQFLGELEGEHSPIMEWNEPEKQWRWSHGSFSLDNNLSGLLDRCRKEFDAKKLQYTVWNILTIWVEQRKELSGAPLQQLDLRTFLFNGNRISRSGLVTKFSGSIINTENLFLQGHSESIWSTTYSSDGKYILSGSSDGTAKVWDTTTGACKITIKAKSAIFCAAFSSDDKYIITGLSNGKIKEWDPKTGYLLSSKTCHEEQINGVAYRPNHESSDKKSNYFAKKMRQRQYVTCSDDGTAKVWMARLFLFPLIGHRMQVSCVAYSPDGTKIVTGSQDSTAKVWDAENGKCLFTTMKEKHSLSINSVTFSSNGKYLVTGGFDKTVNIWDAETGEYIRTLEGHTESIKSVTSCLGERVDQIASCSFDGTVKIWNIKNGELLLNIEDKGSYFKSVAFRPRNLDSNFQHIVASCSSDLKVWDIRTGLCIQKIKGGNSSVNDIAHGPIGKRMITVSEDNTAKILDTPTGTCLMTLKHKNRVKSVAISPDGTRIVTGTYEGLAKIWDVNGGRILYTLRGHHSIVNGVAYSPDGNQIITGSQDSMVKIWNAENGEWLVDLHHESPVLSLKYTPYGRHIITGLSDGTTKVWDAESHREIKSFKNENSLAVNNLACSPDGKSIATTGVFGGRVILIWNVEKPNPQRVLNLDSEKSNLKKKMNRLIQPNTSMECVAFKPDGTFVVTGLSNGKVLVWWSKTGDYLFALGSKWINKIYGKFITEFNSSHKTSPITSIEYSPDGNILTTTSKNGAVTTWFDFGVMKYSIPNLPGLIMHGCDFRNLHYHSRISKTSRAILKKYGVIFSEEDQRRWNGLMAMHLRNK